MIKSKRTLEILKIHNNEFGVFILVAYYMMVGFRYGFKVCIHKYVYNSHRTCIVNSENTRTHVRDILLYKYSIYTRVVFHSVGGGGGGGGRARLVETIIHSVWL